MTVLSIEQVAGYAAGAGFTGEALAIATAIAMAESGGKSDAIGDVALESATWGPSVGPWQIRSLNAQRGTGGQRDEIANMDPATNARHAYEISNSGKSFGAWSTYTSGKYRAYIAQARMAAQNPSAVPAGGGAPVAASAGGSALDVLVDSGTWSRLGLFLFGGILILIALYKMTGINAVQVAKSAVKVAV